MFSHFWGNTNIDTEASNYDEDIFLNRNNNSPNYVECVDEITQSLSKKTFNNNDIDHYSPTNLLPLDSLLETSELMFPEAHITNKNKNNNNNNDNNDNNCDDNNNDNCDDNNNDNNCDDNNNNDNNIDSTGLLSTSNIRILFNSYNNIHNSNNEDNSLESNNINSNENSYNSINNECDKISVSHDSWNVIPKNIDFEDNTHHPIEQYFDQLNLSQEEHEGLETLCKWIRDDEESLSMVEELSIGDVVLSYFSSYSPHNPDPQGCWQRWIKFRKESPLKDVDIQEIQDFLDTGVFNVGFDKEHRPIWFINCQHYNDNFSAEIITKATLLMVTSLLWNVKKNEFDFVALRKGICVYLNLTGFGINMMSWKTVLLLKNSLIAFPYQLIDIYVVNAPSLIYILRQVAAKIVVPHAMNKFIVFKNANQLFENYANINDIPVVGGGLSKMTATQWAKQRGFLEDV